MSDGKKGCQKPSELKGKPQQCAPEQIRKCHGDVARHPCTTGVCERPAELRGEPEACLPEQVRKCHGEVKGHPCIK